VTQSIVTDAEALVISAAIVAEVSSFFVFMMCVF
jgi:hypothetical protein